MSDEGKFLPIVFAPGIYKDITEYSAEGAYVSCQNIRFRDGEPEKRGGHVHEQTYQADQPSRTTFHGVARDIKIWKGLDSTKYLALGTNEMLELLVNGQYYDITPIRASLAATSAISTQAGSTFVTVSLTAHTAQVGDYIFFPTTVSPTVGGNIVLFGDYQISSVINPNAVQIDSRVTAAATSISSGGAFTGSYLLPTGYESNGFSYGWGTGTWGRDGWGTPASSGTIQKLAQWSLDTYGQDLLACRRGGYIYRWVASSGTGVRAAVVTAAPTINNIVAVFNPARHICSYGCTGEDGIYNPLLVRWSDQENINVWSAAVSNLAGEFPLQGGNEIMGVVPTKKEYLILTDAAIYTQTYLANSNVFSFEQVADSAGLISQHAAVDVNGTPYWMSFGQFYRYNGVVQPLPSTMDKSLFLASSEDSINFDQKEKVFCGVNSLFNEIIWLYPSRDSIENNRYVILNYVDNVWYDGNIERTVWADLDIFSKPYATSPDGVLYIQEEGYNDDANPLPALLQSSWFDLDEGTDMLFIDKFVPDIRRLNGKSLTFTIQTRKYPNDPETVTKGPYTITPTTRKTSLRARGRQARITYEQNITNGDFEIGKNRVLIQPDGKR